MADPQRDAKRLPRDGAWVEKLTGVIDLSRRPAGMRVIVGAERLDTGSQLRLSQFNGNRPH